MSHDEIIEAVHALNPRALQRARRFACALALLRAGMSRREACATLRLRYRIIQQEAWRLVDMAADIALIEKDGKR